jgi:hypothetical protein
VRLHRARSPPDPGVPTGRGIGTGRDRRRAASVINHTGHTVAPELRHIYGATETHHHPPPHWHGRIEAPDTTGGCAQSISLARNAHGLPRIR